MAAKALSFFVLAQAGLVCAAPQHGAVVGAGAKGLQPCADIADKVCRADESLKFQERAEALADRTRADLDAIADQTSGKSWPDELYSRLEAAGYLPRNDMDEAAWRGFVEKVSDGTLGDPFETLLSEPVAQCLDGSAERAEIEKEIVRLWTSEGGPSADLFNRTLLAGSSEIKRAALPRFRRSVAAFKDTPVAKKFAADFDKWGLSQDVAVTSKSYLSTYKTYLKAEHDFIDTQRSEAAKQFAANSALTLKSLRLCAIMSKLSYESEGCLEQFFDPTQGLLLVPEAAVLEKRVADFEAQVLERFTQAPEGREALTGLPKELFPQVAPASGEASIEKLLAQPAPKNFDAGARVAAALPMLPTLDLSQALCAELRGVASMQIASIVKQFRQDLHLSKPFLAKVRERMYSPQAVTDQRRRFEAAKSLVSDVLESKILPRVQDASKASVLRASLTDLQLHIPPAVDELPFMTRPGAKTPTLDLKKLDAMPDSTVNFYSKLIAPDFSGVADINAYYTPEHSLGTRRDPKNVFVYPGLIEAFSDSPAALMGILAHEVGHNFDPRMSQLGGHALKPEFQKLLDCLEKSTSAGMHEHQGNECVADWIAAEAMASLIDDPVRRKEFGMPAKDFDFVKQMMAPFCNFMDMEGAGPLQDPENYLSPRRRINGLFGAQPRLRAALGCDASGSTYCSLDGGGQP